MAKQRNTKTDLGVIPVQPAASPVSLLEAPNVRIPSDTNDMLQFGDALKQFVPGITAGLTAFADQEKRAGEAAALSADSNTLQAVREKNREDLRRAVKAGEIPAGASPWFVKGMRRQALRISAQEYSQALTEAWEKSDLKDSEDPQAVQEMVQGFTETYVKFRGLENDPEFQDVFVPLATQVQGNLAAHHTAYRIARNEQKVVEQTEQEINLLIDAGNLNEQPVEDIAPFIQGIIDENIANGADPVQMNQAALKAIARAAEENESYDMTRLPSLLTAGSGSLGNTNASRELMLQVQQQIASKQNHKNGNGLAEAKAERDATIQAIENKTVEALLENPNADITDFQKQMAALDGSKAAGFVNLQNTFRQARNTKDSDEDVIALLEGVFVDEWGPERLSKEIVGREVSTETLGRLFDDARAVAKVPTDIKGIVTDFSQAVFSALQGSPFETDMDKLTDRTQRANAAKLTMNTQMTAWIIRKTQAGEPIDFVEASKYAEDLRLSILGNPRFSGSKPQTVRADIPAPTPAVPRTKVQSKAQTKPLYKSRSDIQEAAVAYAALPPDQQATSRLAIQADALGMTVEELIRAQAAALARPQK